MAAIFEKHLRIWFGYLRFAIIRKRSIIILIIDHHYTSIYHLRATLFLHTCYMMWCWIVIVCIGIVINFCNHEVLSSCPLSSNGYFLWHQMWSFVNVKCRKEPTFSSKILLSPQILCFFTSIITKDRKTVKNVTLEDEWCIVGTMVIIDSKLGFQVRINISHHLFYSYPSIL